jgi:dTDP-4-dehydrorhamnose reductase|nr:dTDP-4-dehydrorhamnose reductase [Candidatus Krumholzibacteria bacterium]
MRILVTGAEGMLGHTVVQQLQPLHDMSGIDLAHGDLTVPGTAEALLEEYRPEWVIHCAAWTDVDGAETSRELALAVNGTATGLMARACDQVGCGLTYLSTDYVFNGQGGPEGYGEDDARDPVNYYGLTKAAGEEAVEAMTAPWQIVRISWLFGDGPVNFPRTMRRLLAERKTLRVVNDQTGCPTYTVDLAQVLAFLVSGRHRGIFHATNGGVCTWWDLAREVARLEATDPGRVHPCASSEYPTAAVRPRCSVLHSTRLEALGCPDRPHWTDALARYLASLSAGQGRFA